ncbi:cadherin-1-like isoform 1-T3 [Anomaloglossus baeobatrachus]|uniref:cadherin-1-like n=1 Tax=Anomaloglossus baeobatrachus TaxID=238106 RepID=UPI003F4FA75F
MGMNKRSYLGLVLLGVLLQIAGGLAEWEICVFGFTNKKYQFPVSKSLEEGAVVGQVDYEKCEAPIAIKYVSRDPDFQVQADGTITVKNHVKIRTQRKFQVDAHDDKTRVSSTTVTLKEHGHHRKPEHGHHHKNSEHSLRRQKRDWVIPPVFSPENERGPFPKRVIQIKSSRADEIPVFYSITGRGADSPPIGLFVMEKSTGWLNVTKPMDREEIPIYNIFVYAVSGSGQSLESPVEILVRVTDQNDNRPYFIQPVFEGEVAEGSKPGTSVMTVEALDLDDTVTVNNGIVAYSIISQDPPLPSSNMFAIDPVSGVISVLQTGLDREKYPQYNLVIAATDQEGMGFETMGKAVITITDTNDNNPIFDPMTYRAEVPENRVGFEVTRLTVTDEDTPNTDAWRAVYKITKGNEGNVFGISTTEDNMGLITTVKGLDFETKREYILSVTATNKANYSVTTLPTSTATVTVIVTDVNEAPVFDPVEKKVSVSEDLPSGQEVASYTAVDPDKVQNQKITYYIGNDPARWLSVNPENGIITGNGQLDRESMFVKNNTYKAIILAVDNGSPVTTGTGTLQLNLLDVNDNGPFLEDDKITWCTKNTDPLLINIIDRDEKPYTDPYMAEINREARENWTTAVVNNQFEIKPKKELEEDIYFMTVTMLDADGMKNNTMLTIQVCQCEYGTCNEAKALDGGLGIPVILGILGGILALLILLLLLLLFVRKKKVVKEPLLPPEDENRDNVYHYDEEGGGEEDQDFDLGQLHRGLDARPDIIRNDVAPTLMPAPQYRPRPANPDEIGNFIDENLNAADNDPTAPPYDSLLVFDYEGSGSEAASLSSLNSSNSDTDQDYTALNNWGPRFSKLADMYGGDED